VNTSPHIAFGPWQIRHNEPIALQDNQIEIQRVTSAATIGHFSAVVDYRDCMNTDVTSWASRGCDAHYAVSAQRIPLAILDLSQDARPEITHLLLRIERGLYQFARPMRSDHSNSADLAERLRALHEANHLTHNNYECLYFSSPRGRDVGVTYELIGDFSLENIAIEIANTFRVGSRQSFVLQIGNEIQHWQYHFDLTRDEVLRRFQVRAHLDRSRTKRWMTQRSSIYKIALDTESESYLIAPVDVTEDAMSTHSMVRISGEIAVSVVGIESVDTGHIYQLVLSRTLARSDHEGRAITVRVGNSRVPLDPRVVEREILVLTEVCEEIARSYRGLQLRRVTQQDALARSLNLHGPWA
jgi:hypothetical protein